MKNISKILLYTVCLIYLLFIVAHLSFRICPEGVFLLQNSSEKITADHSGNAELHGGKININTASADTLTMLPGIGEKLSERIVEYRQKNGPFRKVSDLLSIKGIGQALLDSISDYITLGG